LRASKVRDIKPPEINFHGEDCPGYNGLDAWAHVHPDLWKICVPTNMLKIMTFEKIEETATHEVAHLLDYSGGSPHGPEFVKQDVITKIRSWIAKKWSGVIHFYPEFDELVGTKCYYSNCEQNSNLKKCEYCGNDFCENHIVPEQLIREKKVSNEFRNLKGHECGTLTEVDRIEHLRKSGYIDTHWFLTRIYNPNLNAFIAKFRTLIYDKQSTPRIKKVRHQEVEYLSPIADKLEFEREDIFWVKEPLDEISFRNQISFIFSVYEEGLKIKIYRPDIHEILFSPLWNLFESLDIYWNTHYYTERAKKVENDFKSKIEAELRKEELSTKSQPKIEAKVGGELKPASDGLPNDCPICKVNLRSDRGYNGLLCFYCKEFFCPEHHSPDLHKCTNKPKEKEEPPKCFSCEKKLPNLALTYKCPHCNETFCSVHINPETHICPKVSEPSPKGSTTIEYEHTSRKNIKIAGVALGVILLLGVVAFVSLSNKPDVDGGPPGTTPPVITAETIPPTTILPTTKPPTKIPSWMNIELTDVLTGNEFKISDFMGQSILLQSIDVDSSNSLKQQGFFKELSTTNDVVLITIDTDSNDDRRTLKGYAEKHGFHWYYAVSPPELTQTLVDEFGLDIINHEKVPVVLICEDLSAQLLDSGVKSSETLTKALNDC